MPKKLVSKDGYYIMTKDFRRIENVIKIKLSELKKIVEHAEKIKKQFKNHSCNACYKHLSEDVTFLIYNNK